MRVFWAFGLAALLATLLAACGGGDSAPAGPGAPAATGAPAPAATGAPAPAASPAGTSSPGYDYGY